MPIKYGVIAKNKIAIKLIIFRILNKFAAINKADVIKNIINNCFNKPVLEFPKSNKLIG